MGDRVIRYVFVDGSRLRTSSDRRVTRVSSRSKYGACQLRMCLMFLHAFSFAVTFGAGPSLPVQVGQIGRSRCNVRSSLGSGIHEECRLHAVKHGALSSTSLL